MKRSTKPITSYPIRTRRTPVFREPKCTVCGNDIVMGERYYDKTCYPVHEGCVKLLKAEGSGI